MSNQVNQAPVQGGAMMPTEKNDITTQICKYNVAGEEVKLSFDIVRKYLVRGNADVTNQELVLFINTCKFNQLNPFLNEAYLIKFKNNRGGDETAQMIVSKEALLKRADACPEYEGIEAGIIVMRNGEPVELEGCFHLQGDVLVGGWAKVYRKDRRKPIVAKVNLSEYDKGQSIWNGKKSTMISKVAKVQALREAFPAQLGAMYTREESNVEDADFVEIKDDANKETIGIAPSNVDPETGEVKTPVNEPANIPASAQPANPGF